MSPSLFNFYTHDIPNAEKDNINVAYADDVTHIIRCRSKSDNMLRKETEREIERVNDFEKVWKIRTNMPKFAIVPIQGRRKNNIRINNREIVYSGETKVLGANDYK